MCMYMCNSYILHLCMHFVCNLIMFKVILHTHKILFSCFFYPTGRLQLHPIVVTELHVAGDDLHSRLKQSEV